MVKRIVLLLLVFILVIPTGSSLAELKLRDTTPAQKMLKAYMEKVNSFLLENGEQPINKIFDQANSIVEMGITLTDDAFIPEGVTVTVHLYYDQLWYMLVRVNNENMARFPRIAGAFVRALNPNTMSQAESMKTATARVQKAYESPDAPFEDYRYDKYEDRETSILNGERPQTYYAYYPNQYQEKNRVDWMELMIVFPMTQYWDVETGVITDGGVTNSRKYVDENGQDIPDSSFAEDESGNYAHIELYATPTPEPDSAAGTDGWYGQ
ncbi:MAG: hypothetical protein IKZ98_06825 [Clostridia bacterium]|nr:hypothetical protein [Clostridia bacterium]